MRKLQLFVFLLLVTPVAFAGLGSLGKVILKEISPSTTTLPPNSKNASDLMSRITGLKKASKKIGENLPEKEKREVAEELEKIVFYELRKRGFSESIALACPNCLPEGLADSTNARILDILLDYNALLSKALLEADQVVLVDQNGVKIASNQLRKDAFRDVINQYDRIFADESVNSWSNYLSSIRKTISGSGIEAEIDAAKKTLSVTLSSGSLKGKVVNIDLSRHYEKLKIYIAGGGMAALGYSAGGSKQNGTTTDEMKRQAFIIRSFNANERRILIQKVEVEYIVDLYQQRTKK